MTLCAGRQGYDHCEGGIRSGNVDRYREKGEEMLWV